MDNRKEVILSDLAGLCWPVENLSPLRETGKWNTVSYETAQISGTLLIALGDSRPVDVRLSPNLAGWYRIFVGMPIYKTSGARSSLNLSLTGDNILTHFSNQAHAGFAHNQIQEAFWRCTDMTDQDIIIGKYPDGKDLDAAIAWLRFEPMAEEEVEAFRKDQARTDTRRIYATNDMHGMLCLYGMKTPEQWRSIVDDYDQSDVGWLSMENIFIFDGEPTTGSVETFAYPRPADRRFHSLVKDSYTPSMLKEVIAYGHSKGMKMCGSVRMGGWAMEFPFDQNYFANRFFLANQHLRCVDRDGDRISSLSYLYPEVQDYIIQRMLEMAKLGVDAVELMANRGVPYLLFEQPFVDAFFARYGEDPRYLPLDEARVTALRCQLMAGFFRRLRKALDDACGKGKVRIHLRTLFSLYDSRHVGLDPELLAKEGLIDAVISFPLRLRERLSGNIWQADGVHIDLEKYHQFVCSGGEPNIFRTQNFNFLPPMPDSRGVPQGPESQQQRVREFMELKRTCGIDVYFDILPRVMMPAEIRDRALELYRCGAEGISLWDTYNRAPIRPCWSMMRRIGHKEELAGWTSGEGVWYRTLRVLKYADLDVSRYFPCWGG